MALHGTEILRKVRESFAKVARKLRYPKSMGPPFNTYVKGNSRKLAKDEANQAKQRRKLRVLCGTCAASSSSDVQIQRVIPVLLHLRLTGQQASKRARKHVHRCPQAFIVSPYNEDKKYCALGLRYTPPLSPRKGRESSCLPRCSEKAKTVVAKATRKFSRRYVASIIKSRRSFFQSSRGKYMTVGWTY